MIQEMHTMTRMWFMTICHTITCTCKPQASIWPNLKIFLGLCLHFLDECLIDVVVVQMEDQPCTKQEMCFLHLTEEVSVKGQLSVFLFCL